jgi:hypothetical protein
MRDIFISTKASGNDLIVNKSFSINHKVGCSRNTYLIYYKIVNIPDDVSDDNVILSFKKCPINPCLDEPNSFIYEYEAIDQGSKTGKIARPFTA